MPKHFRCPQLNSHHSSPLLRRETCCRATRCFLGGCPIDGTFVGLTWSVSLSAPVRRCPLPRDRLLHGCVDQQLDTLGLGSAIPIQAPKHVDPNASWRPGRLGGPSGLSYTTWEVDWQRKSERHKGQGSKATSSPLRGSGFIPTLACTGLVRKQPPATLSAWALVRAGLPANIGVPTLPLQLSQLSPVKSTQFARCVRCVVPAKGRCLMTAPKRPPRPSPASTCGDSPRHSQAVSKGPQLHPCSARPGTATPNQSTVLWSYWLLLNLDTDHCYSCSPPNPSHRAWRGGRLRRTSIISTPASSRRYKVPVPDHMY